MFVSPTSYYYLTLSLFVLCWGLMYCIVQSPFGWVLRGIRENEDRIRSMGYNSHLYKTAVFSLSAMFAGVAGMLLAHYNWFANPQDLYWTMSGHGLVMIIVGGLGTLTGPMLGAVILEGLSLWTARVNSPLPGTDQRT
jgi:branched-chain amino acid transport system permease protein